MRLLYDTLGSERLCFHVVQTKGDLRVVRDFINTHAGHTLGIDTESTGINPYVPGWELRTFQFGTADTAFVVPARAKNLLRWLCASARNIEWVGHNLPHDVRSIDVWLGEETGILDRPHHETHTMVHLFDSRGKEDGGVGHGLKEACEFYVSRDAGKWERELKKAFKAIRVPIPGEVYKSGPRKGTQKMRTIKMSEGWSLVDLSLDAYARYAASDPILTMRLYWALLPTLAIENHQKLYAFDNRVAHAADKLTRRAMALDVAYTKRLRSELFEKAKRVSPWPDGRLGTPAQLAQEMIKRGAILTEVTKTGKPSTDAFVLRSTLAKARETGNTALIEFVERVLITKQLLKRADAHVGSLITEMDENGRIHPSINVLAARTARMSVSKPPLHQLPTKSDDLEVE